MTVNLIWAESLNGVIGANGKLPWHLPEDLARFKLLTSGGTLIMGRKTFESLPGLLPWRRHVVVSRNRNLTFTDVTVKPSIGHALEYAGPDNTWVIGGEAVFEAALPYADVLEVTKVHVQALGDTIAPTINFDDWALVGSSGLLTSDTAGIGYEFCTYERKAEPSNG